ncbi:FkbM family methyltransferase [Maritimibacter sp. DP1N21-5]|uniref:FkbM family methyltransferase n=1 Tax=Maritimibacter sp. DP1N21-5 TaxID=2836867 RepID=UPI001C460050|nr:FkbM family methyltransferase [Maritimibacter sp. DP1N21-5]MBV7409812.1 FkbM family methyltransferase [Maritimibacter sp. DP1N21-5]
MAKDAAKLGPDAARTEFLLRVLDPARRLVIADVGARKISTPPPYDELRAKNGCEVVGFEPNEAAFAVLHAEKSPNSTFYNVAVGEPGPATFYNHPIGSISSLFPISEKAAVFMAKFHWINRPELEKIPLTLTALDDVEGLDHLDVLKIDIQGGELGAIRSGKKLLSEAVAIITEVAFHPVYEGAPQWRDVDALLVDMGFVLHKITTTHHAMVRNSQRKSFAHKAHQSQLIDGDAVYVRSANALGELSDLQLKHLALAADTMFQSFDLVIACLDELVTRGAIPDGVPHRYFKKLPDALKAEA